MRTTAGRDDPEPKALACYGLWLPERERMLLRFVAGRPVSAVTCAFLARVAERMAAEPTMLTDGQMDKITAGQTFEPVFSTTQGDKTGQNLHVAQPAAENGGGGAKARTKRRDGTRQRARMPSRIRVRASTRCWGGWHRAW